MRRIRSMNCSCVNCTSGCASKIREARGVRSKVWRRFAALFACLTITFAAIAFLFAPGESAARNEAFHETPEIAYAALPREAQQTLQTVKRGGPFPFERDGAIFGNYERRLPQRNRGYYHEYTVPTPGVRSRGARRIIAGAAAEYY